MSKLNVSAAKASISSATVGSDKARSSIGLSAELASSSTTSKRRSATTSRTTSPRAQTSSGTNSVNSAVSAGDGVDKRRRQRTASAVDTDAAATPNSVSIQLPSTSSVISSNPNTPSKKFKLLSAKSSSSENVDNSALSSSDDEDDSDQFRRKPAAFTADKVSVVAYAASNTSITARSTTTTVSMAAQTIVSMEGSATADDESGKQKTKKKTPAAKDGEVALANVSTNSLPAVAAKKRTSASKALQVTD